MVKLIALVRRKPGMSAEEFHSYWRDQHGPLVVDALGRYIVRYEQNHRKGADDDGFDGVAIQWFRSLDDFDAMVRDPAYAEVVAPDEERFLDRESLLWIMTEEPDVLVDTVELDARPLAGKGAVVTDGRSEVGRGLAAGLVRAGARVALLDDDNLATADAAFRAMTDAAEDLGSLDVVIHNAFSTPTLGPLVTLDEAAWDAACEAPLRRTLYCLQGAFPHLRSGGGRMIVVTPVSGMTGARGRVAANARAEGQRALAKSAARQWGKHGITVNCIALGAPDAPEALSLVPPALGRVADPATDIAPVVVFLGSPAGHFVTGATLTIDGGNWMAP